MNGWVFVYRGEEFESPDPAVRDSYNLTGAVARVDCCFWAGGSIRLNIDFREGESGVDANALPPQSKTRWRACRAVTGWATGWVFDYRGEELEPTHPAVRDCYNLTGAGARGG